MSRISEPVAEEVVDRALHSTRKKIGHVHFKAWIAQVLLQKAMTATSGKSSKIRPGWKRTFVMSQYQLVQHLCVNPWRIALTESHAHISRLRGKSVKLFDPEVVVGWCAGRSGAVPGILG